MKLSWGFVASSLYGSALAVRPSVGPETARLILAQRLGLSRFHSIAHVDPETIRHINAFGGRQQKLFGGDDAARSKAHLLMWIEDAEQDEATVIVNDGSDRTRDFVITNPPPASENDRLIEDFILQAESLPEYPDPQQHTFSAGFEIEAVLPPNNKLKCYNEYLSVFRTGNKEFSSEEIAKVLSKVNKKAEELEFSVTIVMIPASKPHSKRAAHPWGTYDLPSKAGRRENPEALLSSNPVPSSSPNPKVSDLEDFPVIAFAEDKGPVRGILPSCFDTLSGCQKQTHNCSSHGECKLLHKGRGSGTDRESMDCYGCACTPTVEHVDEDKGMESKRKVTYWGGPACQKKDISVQFWLFVGTGVMLAFLVSSGIGMLYSMGGEELPSVIGAGVSGPIRK
ncbi:hypothetical protein BKA66DRAFT_545470 [Pyrenochaeta sp. MPI-SDFR-AT-0127]|nr:hypothetical protein BKA66DRAFT_545470 [Pyrenochaeta sp. MPI-SDFR-AT-0127]